MQYLPLKLKFFWPFSIYLFSYFLTYTTILNVKTHKYINTLSHTHPPTHTVCVRITLLSAYSSLSRRVAGKPAGENYAADNISRPLTHVSLSRGGLIKLLKLREEWEAKSISGYTRWHRFRVALEMRGEKDGIFIRLLGALVTSMRRFMFCIISVGPIPNHVAFIMDGNRRYAKKNKLEEGSGHNAGFMALMSLLQYCYELGLKYITVYAFSIDNFKRRPEEVQLVMDLMLEKIEGLLKEESIVNQYGVRVYFIGNLNLLHEPVRVAAEKAMLATAKNSKNVLLICVAYTSTDEITHSAQESCVKKEDEIRKSTANGDYDGEINEQKEEKRIIRLVDLENHMYMGVAPDPDLLIRSSGETRLSNFLLWQSNNCVLYSPKALWPEIGLWHVMWAILNFQRNHSYVQKKIKQL